MERNDKARNNCCSHPVGTSGAVSALETMSMRYNLTGSNRVEKVEEQEADEDGSKPQTVALTPV